MLNITIDTTAIQNTGTIMKKSAQEGKKLAARLELHSYKAKTFVIFGPQKTLSSEDCKAVKALALQMEKYDWLTSEDYVWLREQGITLKK